MTSINVLDGVVKQRLYLLVASQLCRRSRRLGLPGFDDIVSELIHHLERLLEDFLPADLQDPLHSP